jgi:3-oxoadipate enol-lactonase
LARRLLPDAWAQRLLARERLAATGFADWAERELLRRDPRAVLQAAATLGGYTAEPWIGDIDVPTSVLVHTRDELVPPRRQLELAAVVPGAVAHFVDADHRAVVRDRELFGRALVRAVDDVTSAPVSATVMRRAS